MPELTAEELTALIANIDLSIARIVAVDATDHTIGGQGGHSVKNSSSLKALRELRKDYREQLGDVKAADPAFLQTNVDLADA